MVKRSTSKKEADPKKRPVPVDPYEIPDDDDVPARKRTRASLRQTKEAEEEEEQVEEEEQDTRNGARANLRGGESEPLPKPKRRGRPPRGDLSEAPNGEISTPTSVRQKKTATETPSRNRLNGVDTPSRRNIADRSARRKSARALIDRVVEGAISDDEDDGIAREIYESSEEEEEEEEEEDGDGQQQQHQEEPESADDDQGEVAPTPSKRRGRPPGSGKRAQQKRSPTPPGDLPPYERYFYQNKPGRAKTSNNTLSSLDLLTHDEYFSVLRQTKDHHSENIRFLESLHAESFPQWYFELSQGFTCCLYGYGSKRRLMHQFASYISTKQKQSPHSQTNQNNKIVIINGYIRTLTIREILSTIGTAVDPSQRIPSGNPIVMVQNLFRLLSSPEQQETNTSLCLFINSIDALALRKPAIQSILAQVSSHPKIKTVCSADTADFSLLWDSGLRSSFNFTFHDCTTFSPLAGGGSGGDDVVGGEIDVVDQVHELLGRMARRAGGKEGVTFVLRSLPENAKNLFRLLVTEVLVAMDEADGNENASGTGVEYRILYNKAVEEFICSSEMAFRTLLKEFHDHQIIESSKDALGTELLSLPFRKDELGSILEDLMA